MASTILGRPFQIKSGMVDSSSKNVVTNMVFGASFPVINKIRTNKKAHPAYVTDEQVAVFF